MKNNKSIFELKNEFDNMNVAISEHINNIFDTFNNSNKQLLNFESKIIDKQVLYIATNQDIKQGIENIKEDKEKYKLDNEMTRIIDRLSEITYVDKYSKINILVWLKRYYRLYKTLDNDIYRLKEKSREFLSTIKKMYSELEPYSNFIVAKEMYSKLDLHRQNLLKSTTFEFHMHDGYSTIEQIFMFDPIINKTDFVSILSLRKCEKVVNLINNSEDNLTLDKIRKLIFVESIEDYDDEFFNSFMFEHIMKLRESNKEIAEQMDFKIGLNNIPSFSVSFDEFGEVADIKQNKPKLTLVQ